MLPATNSAIDILYIAHKNWLHSLLHRRCGCLHTAADLTQDVFLRLLGKPAVPPMNEPRAYLARIAHGLLVDHHRRQALEKAWREAMGTLPAEYAPSAEEQFLIIEALARIDALLEGLKPRIREAFLLSRLENKSYPAIAEQLGVSLSTIEKDMAQALRHCYHVLMG